MGLDVDAARRVARLVVEDDDAEVLGRAVVALAGGEAPGAVAAMVVGLVAVAVVVGLAAVVVVVALVALAAVVALAVVAVVVALVALATPVAMPLYSRV